MDVRAQNVGEKFDKSSKSYVAYQIKGNFIWNLNVVINLENSNFWDLGTSKEIKIFKL